MQCVETQCLKAEHLNLMEVTNVIFKVVCASTSFICYQALFGLITTPRTKINYDRSVETIPQTIFLLNTKNPPPPILWLLTLSEKAHKIKNMIQDDSRLCFVPSSISSKHLIMQNQKSTSHQYFIEILSEKTYIHYIFKMRCRLF